MSRFAACFEDLPDPRGRNARHPLTSILFIAVAAIVCGAESCTDMADFGVAKKKWLKTIVPLPYASRCWRDIRKGHSEQGGWFGGEDAGEAGDLSSGQIAIGRAQR